MSHDLAVKIRLRLDELAVIREQFEPLISTASDAQVGVIETYDQARVEIEVFVRFIEGRD